MSRFGLVLSDDVGFDQLDGSSESKTNKFNYFNYPSKIKQKPFSSVDYSLDEDIIKNILDQPQIDSNKYDKIIEGQEKLLELLKHENNSLKQKNSGLQSTISNLSHAHSHYNNIAQQILPICYLLNLNINSQFIYTQIYQSISNLYAQINSSQAKTSQLQKKVKDTKQTNLARVNSTTYLEKPQYGRDNRSRRNVVQYREKEEVEYVKKLEKQLKQLKEQCNKFKNATPPEPIFINNVKEKKVEIVVEKIVEKQKIVEVEKIKIVEKIVEKTVIVEKIVEKPIYYEKRVKEEVPMYIEKIVQKIVQKPNPIYIDREIEVQKLVYLKQSSGKYYVNQCSQTQ